MKLFDLSGITQEQFLSALHQAPADELKAINKMVVNTLNNRNTALSQLNLAEFQIHDRVWFDSKKYGRVEGSITKKNKKTAELLTASGVRWKVTASQLNKV